MYNFDWTKSWNDNNIQFSFSIVNTIFFNVYSKSKERTIYEKIKILS